ncbi:MAG: hypothetical protein CMJ85_11090, partial [Planctomycetes bacterium]|nr:hypothetical protein [Planctomycetota bacterium]
MPQSSAKPVFLGKPLPGKKADTQSWIVHFKSRPFTLAAFRAEMYGDRNVEKVAAIVADLDTKMKAHQAPLQEA